MPNKRFNKQVSQPLKKVEELEKWVAECLQEEET
jgi:hypothetical protein